MHIGEEVEHGVVVHKDRLHRDLARRHDEGVPAAALVGQRERLAVLVQHGQAFEGVALVGGCRDGHSVALGRGLGRNGHGAVLYIIYRYRIARCGDASAASSTATAAAGGRTSGKGCFGNGTAIHVCLDRNRLDRGGRGQADRTAVNRAGAGRRCAIRCVINGRTGCCAVNLHHLRTTEAGRAVRLEYRRCNGQLGSGLRAAGHRTCLLRIGFRDSHIAGIFRVRRTVRLGVDCGILFPVEAVLRVFHLRNGRCERLLVIIECKTKGKCSRSRRTVCLFDHLGNSSHRTEFLTALYHRGDGLADIVRSQRVLVGIGCDRDVFTAAIPLIGQGAGVIRTGQRCRQLLSKLRSTVDLERSGERRALLQLQGFAFLIIDYGVTRHIRVEKAAVIRVAGFGQGIRCFVGLQRRYGNADVSVGCHIFIQNSSRGNITARPLECKAEVSLCIAGYLAAGQGSCRCFIRHPYAIAAVAGNFAAADGKVAPNHIYAMRHISISDSGVIADFAAVNVNLIASCINRGGIVLTCIRCHLVAADFTAVHIKYTRNTCFSIVQSTGAGAVYINNRLCICRTVRNLTAVHIKCTAIQLYCARIGSVIRYLAAAAAADLAAKEIERAVPQALEQRRIRFPAIRNLNDPAGLSLRAVADREAGAFLQINTTKA